MNVCFAEMPVVLMAKPARIVVRTKTANSIRQHLRQVKKFAATGSELRSAFVQMTGT